MGLQSQTRLKRLKHSTVLHLVGREGSFQTTIRESMIPPVVPALGSHSSYLAFTGRWCFHHSAPTCFLSKSPTAKPSASHRRGGAGGSGPANQSKEFLWQQQQIRSQPETTVKLQKTHTHDKAFAMVTFPTTPPPPGISHLIPEKGDHTERKLASEKDMKL